MIEVPASFRSMPRWRDEHSGWLDELPAIVEKQLRRWDLDIDGSLWHGSNALVVSTRRGSQRFALRLAPYSDDIASEAQALHFWNGRGTVLLIDLDLDANAMLLERLDGSRSLAALPIEEARTELGLSLRRLSVAAPPTADDTGAIAAEIAGCLERFWCQVGRPLPATVLRNIMTRAEALRVAARHVAVNADLHYGQVLAASRRPWLVIDPVLNHGDPEYALGPMLWSRLDEIVGSAALERHINVLVDLAELSSDRSKDWIAVRAAHYMFWGIRHGLTEDPPRCARLIFHVLG